MNEIPLIIKNLSLSSILSGLDKTLNVVNQIIPMYQKIRPLLNNSKDLLNIINNINNNSIDDTKKEIKKVDNNLPTFFQ